MSGEERFRIILDRNSMTFENVLECFLALNVLSRIYRGGNLRFELARELGQISDSDFDTLNKDLASGGKVSLEESFFPKYLPRDEVYKSLDRFAKPDKRDYLREEVDRKFPRESFGEVFPYTSLLVTLINEKIDDLRFDLKL